MNSTRDQSMILLFTLSLVAAYGLIAWWGCSFL